MADINLKELTTKEERFVSGHRACAGCAGPSIIHQMLAVIDEPVVVAQATGCMEIISSIFPYSAWNIPWIHCAFGNAAATISGVETAYRSLKKQGKYNKEVRFIALAGDGGTYDIGIQALSGAAERGHRFMYVCYNNEAYMNTGIQRSGATPLGATTTTAPAGDVKPGKTQQRKDLTAIMAAHNIPYVAQACVSYWKDLMTKVKKAAAADGPSFLNILSPCPLGWGYPTELTIEIGKLAVQSYTWPLYEVENGVYNITLKPPQKKTVEEYLKSQQRFRHLFTDKNKHIIAEAQAYVDAQMDKLQKLCEITKPVS